MSGIGIGIGDIVRVRIENYTDYNSSCPYAFAKVVRVDPLTIRWFYDGPDLNGEGVTLDHMEKQGFDYNNDRALSTQRQTIPRSSCVFVRRPPIDQAFWTYYPSDLTVSYGTHFDEYRRDVKNEAYSIWFTTHITPWLQYYVGFALNPQWRDERSFQLIAGRAFADGVRIGVCGFCKRPDRDLTYNGVDRETGEPLTVDGGWCKQCAVITMPKLRDLYSLLHDNSVSEQHILAHISNDHHHGSQ